jgi:hypothetical protein
MNKALQEIERDVEHARAQLLADLSLVLSPTAFAEFKSDLQEDARSTLHGIVEDIKGRAAANPAAALAIGAGLGWRLLRDPPITTALIAAGLLALWRTAPATPLNGDYLQTAKVRLSEQADDAVDSLSEHTARVAGTVKASVSDFAEATKEKVQDWGSTASEEIVARTVAASHRAASALDNVSHRARAIPSTVRHAIAEPESRDALLLGLAGLAMAAALGIAYQRRSAEARL